MADIWRFHLFSHTQLFLFIRSFAILPSDLRRGRWGQEESKEEGGGGRKKRILLCSRIERESPFSLLLHFPIQSLPLLLRCCLSFFPHEFSDLMIELPPPFSFLVYLCFPEEAGKLTIACSSPGEKRA